MKQKIDQVAVGLIDAGQLTITEQLARLHGEAKHDGSLPIVAPRRNADTGAVPDGR